MRNLLLLIPIVASFVLRGAVINGPIIASADSLLPCPSQIIRRWQTNGLAEGSISNWVDSIQGKTLTQTNAANQPTYSFANGVSFDGSNDFMNWFAVTNVADTSRENYLVVLKHNNTTASQIVMGSALAGGGLFIGISDTGYYYEGNTGGMALGLLPTTRFDFLACKTVLANAYQAYTNGISGWSSAGAGWNDGTTLVFLGSGAGNAFFNGDILEILVWDDCTLTTNQVASIHQYAVQRYGVSP